MSLPPELIKAMRERRLILFVGAGLSVGLGLPTWAQVVDRMATELGYDPRLFRSYGDAWTLAEYYRIRKRSLGALRSWMDTQWHATSVSIGSSEAHKAIIALNCAAIYTTNYDRWIERAYEHYSKPFFPIRTVEDIAASAAHPGMTPIVKFHGDFDDDESLVLTETHFLQRLELESPLDIKLRADLLGRSVLFIGYSLTDPNIRRLLFKLRNAWSTAGLADRQPPLFLFAARPNPVQETVLREWGVSTLTEDIDHPGEALLSLLRNLLDARVG